MTSGHVRICDMTFDLVGSHRGHKVQKGQFGKIATPPTVTINLTKAEIAYNSQVQT